MHTGWRDVQEGAGHSDRVPSGVRVVQADVPTLAGGKPVQQERANLGVDSGPESKQRAVREQASSHYPDRTAPARPEVQDGGNEEERSLLGEQSEPHQPR
jgi:hypothetical protein